MKNILIVKAHPSTLGHTHIIADTYAEVKRAKHDNVKMIDLYAPENRTPLLEFEDIRKHELSKVTKKFQDDIAWANEIVIVHPIWWGTPPSIMKSWTELAFWRGFAYRYENGKLKKLLVGKTAKVFATSGGPSWYFYLPILPFYSFWRISLLGFCGVDVVDMEICGNLDSKRGPVADKLFAKFLKKIKKSAEQK